MGTLMLCQGALLKHTVSQTGALNQLKRVVSVPLTLSERNPLGQTYQIQNFFLYYRGNSCDAGLLDRWGTP